MIKHAIQNNKLTSWYTSYKKGFFCSLLIAFSASFMASHYGGAVMLYALLLGIAFHFLYEDSSCKKGIEFASNTVLKIGIALLGLRISFSQITQLGILPVCIIGIAIGLTIALGVFLSKKTGFSSSFGVLIGGAVAICGASAAVAIASLLPKTAHLKRDVIMTVAIITSLSTLAMISYPIIVSLSEFDTFETAFFLGGTIHDVAQVIGAGYMLSNEVGQTAVIVKLVRITFLTPVMLLVGLAYRNQEASKKVMIPFFLIMFFICVGVANLNVLPQEVIQFTEGISRWCIVIAISALGLKTSLKELSVAGFRPLCLIAILTVSLAILIWSFCFIL